MRAQPEPRVRKRVPCRVSVEGRRHAGIVLNVSPRGLYVQTNALAAPGARVDVHLTPDTGGSIPVQGVVVWRRLVPRELRTDARAGFGLRIESAGESYYSLLAGCLPPEALAAVGAPSGRATASAAAAREPELHSYRVRVAEGAGPRSRWIEVAAEGEAQARQQALCRMGAGWQVLAVERLPAPQ